MDVTNGNMYEPSTFSGLRQLAELPSRLAFAVKAHPLAAVGTIAGVAFLLGTVFGSRTARAIVVAAAPQVTKRLLDGPLGEDLNRYLQGLLHLASSAGQRPAS